jgi:hypothetical protein
MFKIIFVIGIEAWLGARSRYYDTAEIGDESSSRRINRFAIASGPKSTRALWIWPVGFVGGPAASAGQGQRAAKKRLSVQQSVLLALRTPQ